jgi:hypothetical protein
LAISGFTVLIDHALFPVAMVSLVSFCMLELNLLESNSLLRQFRDLHKRSNSCKTFCHNKATFGLCKVEEFIDSCKSLAKEFLSVLDALFVNCSMFNFDARAHPSLEDLLPAL